MLLAARPISGQPLAERALAEIPFLDAAPDLATWRQQHPRERLKNAGYGVEYETQGLWCAASVAEFALPGGMQVTRQAFFYIPPGSPADPLPDHADSELVRQCRLRTLWYEVHDPASPADLARAEGARLTAAFGPAAEPASYQRTDHDWGSGYWNPYRLWESGNRRVVLAVDPGGPLPTARSPQRLLLIARSSLSPRGLFFEWPGKPPKGARVARLGNPCSFDDAHNDWLGRLIRYGEQLLSDGPESGTKPYIDLILARSYAARLALTYPNVEPGGTAKPNHPETLRSSSIAHFRAYLKEAPDSPDAAAARREAWRLLAGLPPSPIHIGCGD